MAGSAMFALGRARGISPAAPGVPDAPAATPLAPKATVLLESSAVAAVWDDGAPIAAGPDAASVLQAALDAASAAGGGAVLVKDCVYALASSVHLRSGVRLLGASWATVLQPRKGPALDTDSPIGDVVLEGFAIDGSQQQPASDPYAKGVYVRQQHGATRIQVERLHVTRTYHTGIGIDNVHAFRVSDCLVEGCSRGADGNGVGIGGPSSEGVIAENVVMGTVQVRSYGYGIILEELARGQPLARIVVADNVSSGNEAAGIGVMGSSACALVGNVCEDNGDAGIHLWQKGPAWDPVSDVDVVGNVCRGNAADGIRADEPAATRLLMQGNLLQGNKGRGIEHRSGQASIVGNTCARNGAEGILLLGAHDTLVEGNACLDNSQSAPDTSDGIAVQDAVETFILGNMCYDSAAPGARTQRYGIATLGTLTDQTFIVDNDVRRNATGGLRPIAVGNVVETGNIG